MAQEPHSYEPTDKEIDQLVRDIGKEPEKEERDKISALLDNEREPFMEKLEKERAKKEAEKAKERENERDK